MPSWKFWDKGPEAATSPERKSLPARRFTAKPRTDLPSATKLDNERQNRMDRLRRQRDEVLFDVEQAESANQTENVWRERVSLLDAALVNVRADREAFRSIYRPTGQSVPPIPIESLTWSDKPVPTVTFLIGSESFEYAEEIDWAERGYQLARSELILMKGDLEHIVPANGPKNERNDLIVHLIGSLFVFASDVRDRAFANQALPQSPTLEDLAKPDMVSGGWLDWLGHSPEGARRENHFRVLEAEEQRLLSERERELEELARWQDRLPIARRRLADVDAAIVALGGEA